jgi:hypothetical protein
MTLRETSTGARLCRCQCANSKRTLSRQAVARRSPSCGYESDGDRSPPSRNQSARRREDRPGCCRIARESAVRASGGSPKSDVDTVNFGLRIVFHDGPVYQGGQRLALPSPRFEMLSSMRTTAANTTITGHRASLATKAQNASRPQPKALHLRLQSPPGLLMSQVDKPRQTT